MLIEGIALARSVTDLHKLVQALQIKSYTNQGSFQADFGQSA
jgi:hypothetical protein